MAREKGARLREKSEGRRLTGSALLATLFLVICGVAFSRQIDTKDLHKLHLNVIVSDHLTPGVNAAEIAAVADIWIKSIGISQGLLVDSKIEVSSSIDVIRKRVDANEIDILTTSALEFLNVDRFNVLEPVMTMSPTDNPKGKIRYLLLTSLESGLSTIESLKNKTVLTYSHSDQGLLRMWTDVLLGSQHLPSAETYFRSVLETLKPSTACLPVFFGKADACIVDDATWSVLRELNPQLAAKLRPIAESPYLIETILALHASRQEYRPEILRGMQSLPDSPSGRQLLIFFKSRRAYRLNKDDLAEVVELRKAYLKLRSPGERKPTHAHSTNPPESEEPRKGG